MKKRLFSMLLTCLFATTLWSTTVHAQAVVSDPQGLAKKIVHIGISTKQLAQQLLTYYRQGQQLKAQMDDLRKMDFRSLQDIQKALGIVSYMLYDLGRIGDSLAYQAQHFEDIYGGDAKIWGDLTISSMKDAIKGSAQTAKTMGAMSAHLSTLETMSRTTTGNLQAAQTSAQLSAVLARQNELMLNEKVRHSTWERNAAIEQRKRRERVNRHYRWKLGSGMGTHKPKVGAVQLIEF